MDEKCAICLEDKLGVLVTTACAHSFHAECFAAFRGAARSRARCPLCRSDLDGSGFSDSDCYDDGVLAAQVALREVQLYEPGVVETSGRVRGILGVAWAKSSYEDRTRKDYVFFTRM